MISQAILVTILLLLATEINSAPVPTATCPTSCGNLSIPFPFGTTTDCCLDDSFLITCNHTCNPPKPFLNQGSIQVLDISLDGLMKVASPVASDCYDYSGSKIKSTILELTLSKFPISSRRNKLTAVGCDTYALADGSEEWKRMKAGCVSWCDSIDSMKNGSCSGIGCCQTSIPKGVKDVLVEIRSFRNHTRVNSFNPCGYAFVVETEAFKFSSSDLKDLQNRKTVPVALDWSVGNLTCQEARRDLLNFACRATHSECIDSSSGIGYNCKCLTGFQGNPYLIDGCQDIDECIASKPCKGTCENLIGSYSCSCPKGFKGDGKKYGSGCYRESLTNGSNLFYIASAEDLKKATDNYDENKVLRREQHFGITYKGILPGVNRIVTIKYCHAFDQCNIEVLISKLVTLSQINHRNVVKLLGCCLETQVPLLVYEFITVKTLFDYINDDCLARSLSWDIRLRVATETAGAIAYMHSSASVPIIHGSLSSSSILLHHGYTVKVHDFALICSECSCLQFYAGSSGYLDPEYFCSGRLTEKSDVYSFGFVLAELLTGKNVMSPEWLEGEKNLAQYFVCSRREADLLEILDHRLVTDGNLDQLTEVAEIAKMCLKSSSVERPTMKDVAIALECVISRNSRVSAPAQARRQVLLEL